MIERAISSVLNQTHESIELIIVDDASSDDTKKVVSEFMDDDDRIRYIRNETSLGGAGARNVGIEDAEGEYCAFLDDDDEWLKNKIELQLKYIDDYSVVGTRKHINNKPKSQKAIPQDSPNISTLDTQDALKGLDHISPSTLLTRTSYLENIGGFDSELGGSEGWDMNVRLISEYGSGGIIESRQIVRYDDHNSSLYSKSEEHFDGAIKSYKKHKKLMSFQTRRIRFSSINLRIILFHPSKFSRLKAILISAFLFDIYLIRFIYSKKYNPIYEYIIKDPNC